MIDIDRVPANADWLRSMKWDVRTPDGNPVRSLGELRMLLGNDDAKLAHFMTLPAAEPMPADLRAEVDTYLGSVAKYLLPR